MSDDLTRLERDLGSVPVAAGKYVLSALRKTAMDAKEQWQGIAKGPSGRHAKAYPFSIDYDVEGGMPEWRAEVGPNLGRAQGALGILEDAPGGVHGGPQKARPKVVKAVERDFQRGLNRAVSDALKGAGL